MRRVDLHVDVTGAGGLSGSLHTAVSVYAPDADPPDGRPRVVAFCWPGSGYSKGYFDIAIDQAEGYSQAAHHTDRDVIVVACDHLGVGASGEPDRSQLSFEALAKVNRATVDGVLAHLRSGELDIAIDAAAPLTLVGLGQSYGGILVIVQQSRQRTFDGIAVLGCSAISIEVPKPQPGATCLTGGPTPDPSTLSGRELRTFAFHWEDVPAAIVAADMKDAPGRRQPPVPMWGSERRPGGPHMTSLAPGLLARWAATVECPVLIGMGERDVCADPRVEPSAYRSSNDVHLVVVPRMGHMHNFAGTRHQLWDAITHWIDGLTT